jgi:hypothetical protein
MRVFQIIITILAAGMSVGMCAFSKWVAANFSKGLPLPECFYPMSVVTMVLVVLLAITVFVRK